MVFGDTLWNAFLHHSQGEFSQNALNMALKNRQQKVLFQLERRYFFNGDTLYEHVICLSDAYPEGYERLGKAWVYFTLFKTRVQICDRSCHSPILLATAHFVLCLFPSRDGFEKRRVCGRLDACQKFGSQKEGEYGRMMNKFLTTIGMPSAEWNYPGQTQLDLPTFIVLTKL